MAMRVLIVSPDAGFGGLIQQTLDSSGGYEPVLVINGRQALELASKLPFDLAIVDSNLAGFSIIELCMALQALSVDIRLILIPNPEDIQALSNTDLRIVGHLSKPFYLPDLLELVGKAHQDKPVKEGPSGRGHAEPEGEEIDLTGKADLQGAAEGEATGQEWLEDVNRAAQHLASLSMESASQAAIILKNGQLWAYAGHLSREEAQELSEIVRRDWQRNLSATTGAPEGSDLARFVRLKVSGEDYMLYATGLDVDMLLVLAFDVRTPISKIRLQASELARSLDTTRELRQSEVQEVLRTESTRAIAPKPRQKPAETPPAPAPEGAAPLLPVEDVPPPTPTNYPGELPEVGKIHWPWEFDPELDDTPELSGFKDELSGGYDFGEEMSRPASGDQVQPGEALPLGGTLPGSRRLRLEPAGEDEEQKLSSDDLRSVPSVILSPPVVYVIHYACVLLPRMPGHRLTGDLSEKLSQWMQNLSIAFGWRLEHIAIDPEYLHWITGATPQVSAEELIQKVRTRTTEMIFSEFPSITRGNLCDDFWAPGYLVVTGSNPLPAELVNEYIEQTRLRQGIPGKR